MREKIKSEPIDGFVYEVHQLPATKGEELGAQLVAMLAPMIGALAGEGSSKIEIEAKKSIGDFDLRSLGIKAASDVFAKEIASPRLTNMRKLMAEHTEIYGEGFGDAGAPLSRNYDEHFAGRYDAMLEWFMFALEVNFKGFFVGLWERTANRHPLLRSLPSVLSGPPSTLTGESGKSSSPG